MIGSTLCSFKRTTNRISDGGTDGQSLYLQIKKLLVELIGADLVSEIHRVVVTAVTQCVCFVSVNQRVTLISVPLGQLAEKPGPTRSL